jgi:hypothetical protein
MQSWLMLNLDEPAIGRKPNFAQLGQIVRTFADHEVERIDAFTRFLLTAEFA